MPVERTAIEGLLVVRSATHDDERGFFRETYRASELEAVLGRPLRLVQGNHARSAPGVLRGFHAEPWDKLVQVVRGTAMAAIADIRPDSPTFGEVVTVHLGDPPGERLRLFVSDGLANAYCTYGDTEVDYVYDISEEYRPGGARRAVRWDDPELGVRWPVVRPILSVPDAGNPSLRDLVPEHPRWSTR